MTTTSSPASRSSSTIWLPIYPAPPVTNTLIYVSRPAIALGLYQRRTTFCLVETFEAAASSFFHALFNFLVHGFSTAYRPLMADHPIAAFVVANTVGMIVSYRGTRSWAFRNREPVHADGGRTAYLQKQYEYRAAGVNVVELDLLRGGLPTTAFPADRRPPAGTFDYHVSVLVPGAAPYCFLAPIRLTDRLPTLPVPLDPDVPPVPVDLQGVFDRCYDGGRYPELVRYDRDPEPPLTPEQKAWADALLRAKGLLSGGPT